MLTGEQVEELAKLPPVDVLRGQLLGAIVAPLTQLAALLAAPLRDLVGLIDARIDSSARRATSEAEVAKSLLRTSRRRAELLPSGGREPRPADEESQLRPADAEAA